MQNRGFDENMRISATSSSFVRRFPVMGDWDTQLTPLREITVPSLSASDSKSKMSITERNYCIMCAYVHLHQTI